MLEHDRFHTADAILVERREGVVRLVLNRPSTFNSLDRFTLELLGHHVEAESVDPSTRCLILTGTGRAFCSGADLSIDPEQLDDEEAARMMGAASRTITALVQAPVPVLAAVNGPAAGVGASLAFASDLVLASESSYFLLPFTAIGLMPDGGATATVAAALGRSRAMRMALRGERFKAVDAKDAGLVAEVVPTDRLAALADEWAAALASGSREAFRLTKMAINDATLGDLPDVLHREAEGQVGLLAGPDFVREVRAFRDRRVRADAPANHE